MPTATVASQYSKEQYGRWTAGNNSGRYNHTTLPIDEPNENTNIRIKYFIQWYNP
jgi:hypothetical protein